MYRINNNAPRVSTPPTSFADGSVRQVAPSLAGLHDGGIFCNHRGGLSHDLHFTFGHCRRNERGSNPPATITDGTSNTILLGENPADTRGDGNNLRQIGTGSSIADGTSNTIQFGELTPALGDGSVRTVTPPPATPAAETVACGS